jgi:hypothetical protein
MSCAGTPIRCETMMASGSESGTSCRQQAPQPAPQDTLLPCDVAAASLRETIRDVFTQRPFPSSGLSELRGDIIELANINGSLVTYRFTRGPLDQLHFHEVEPDERLES